MADEQEDIGFVRPQGEPWRSDLGVQAAPILAASLVVALTDQIAGADANWAAFVGHFAHGAIQIVPGLVAHLAACRSPLRSGVLIWFAGFVLLPLVLILAGSSFALAAWQSVVVAVFSLIFLLFHPRIHGAIGPGQITRRFPITFDGSLAVLIALWVLGSTSLFASTADAVRNQPLKVLINWQRIVSEPAETLWYLAQFSILGVVLYGWYWFCRYVLVRGVLARRGTVPFVFATVGFVALGAPLAASIGMHLPLNIPEWTIIPSEDHNPFGRANYSFAIWLTVIILPLVLAVERLLQEQTETRNQHERVRAELHLLQQQVNPHFLFNTLNTLYALCLKDRAESAAAVVKLADLLRYVVYRGQAERVTLDEEVDYLRNYLDLQQLRFGHRCALEAHWPERQGTLCLPPLLLIMLVENAFKHGVEPAEGPCVVRINAAVTAGQLQFECVNSLPLGQAAESPGVGLVNLRRRLELLFGQRFVLSAKPSDGLWHARLRLVLDAC